VKRATKGYCPERNQKERENQRLSLEMAKREKEKFSMCRENRHVPGREIVSTMP